ncbi:MAG: hypothetical protein ACPGZP_00900 [Panacagrimonas sp.]
MKKLGIAALACSGLLFAHQASAGSEGAVDLYYIPSAEFEVDVDGFGESEFDDGDGFGAKARFALGSQLFIAGEYQTVEYEELGGLPIDGELDQIRGGLGFWIGADSPFYVAAEAVHLDLDTGDDGDDETGFAAHLGVNAPLGESINLYGQAGYIDVDGDGLELLGGLAFQVTQTLALFADYRHTTLDDDGVEITFSDFRAGIRLALL